MYKFLTILLAIPLLQSDQCTNKKVQEATEMRIQYGLTGPARKSLVAAISQELDTPIEYLGAPMFIYKVGDYHIDKNGVIIGVDNLELVAHLQAIHDFKAVQEDYESAISEPEPVPEDVQIPYEAALGGRISPYHDTEEPPAYGSPEATLEDEIDILTIEMPLDGFTDESIANLEKLIASKATLIKKAIGINELPIEQTNTTLQFPWFSFSSSIEEVAAYTRFVVALCDAAKKQKRITAREKVVDNEKFAFRVFLIRLGFVGDEFKNVRKILLRNLSGNSAFKNGGPKKSTDPAENEVPHE